MTDKLYTLPIKDAITPIISLRQQDQLDIIVVDHPRVHAAIALQGAHLLTFRPQGQDEVLWLSEKTPFHTGIALRGGVPICWPWFGPAAEPGGPSHGFARIQPWQLSAHHTDEDGVSLTFQLSSTPETLKIWPHAFTLIARFTLKDRCEITLEAQGDFETTSALHSYFNVGEINEIEVSGLGHPFIDKVRGGQQDSLADGIERFPDRTDRIYTKPDANSKILDKKLGRTLLVTHQHNHDVVAWNPGPALSQSMSDMSDTGYKTFVCVETCWASAPQKVTPQTPSLLAQTISIIK